MSKIADARERLRVLQEQNRAAEASLKLEIGRAVAEAYQDGASVSSLCREYGTTARATIINILRAAGVYDSDRYGWKVDRK